MKQMTDEHGDWLSATVAEAQKAREMNKLPDIVPASAGGYNKTSTYSPANPWHPTIGFICPPYSGGLPLPLRRGMHIMHPRLRRRLFEHTDEDAICGGDADDEMDD